MRIDTLRRAHSNLPAHWVADWLLFVLKKPPSFLFSHPDHKLTDDEYRTFIAGIRRMNQGIPLAYLTQTAHFWSMAFYVNEHTLIPRPDTELLVQTVLSALAQTPSDTLLELGTGSGCIAISLKKHLPNWHVCASDVSKEALKVAQHNAKHHGVCVAFLCSDWFCRIQGVFSVIVSNPPYIANDDPHLPALSAEPSTALVADNDGLSDIEHIILQSPKYLDNGGLLVIEHGHQQGDKVRALFENSGFSEVATIKDYGGNERLTLGFFWRNRCDTI